MVPSDRWGGGRGVGVQPDMVGCRRMDGWGGGGGKKRVVSCLKAHSLCHKPITFSGPCRCWS
uniref:Uncharacterized protein n=1 Tax=Setaria italica TaxID=4555 RepID=K3Y0R8_SETIT